MAEHGRSRAGSRKGATRCTKATTVGLDGTLTGRIRLGDGRGGVGDDQIPDTDITTIAGTRWLTPLRTIIEVASDLDADDLGAVVEDGLRLGAFTLDEAWARLADPDMADRPGAEVLRRHLRART